MIVSMKIIMAADSSVKWRALTYSYKPSTWKSIAVNSGSPLTKWSGSKNLSAVACERMQAQPRRNLSSSSGAGANNGSANDNDLFPYSFNNSISGSQTQPGNDINVLEYIESIQQSGNVAVLFSDAPPVLWAVEALCTIKDFPGMTWISTIVFGTLLLRVVIGVPIAIAQTKAMARLESLKPEIQKLGEELKLETAVAVKKFKWDEKTTRRQFTKSYKKHWKNLVEKNNCHPMKNLALSLTQLPFWICFSSALRNVVYAVPFPRTSDKMDRWVQIHNEGTPWVESLVIPDPIVFPAVFLVVNFLNIEFSRKQRLQTLPQTKFQKILPWLIRGGIVTIACVATSVPSAVSMYWATSSSLAFVQNVVLTSPVAKRMFKIPKITVQSSSIKK